MFSQLKLTSTDALSSANQIEIENVDQAIIHVAPFLSNVMAELRKMLDATYPG